MIRLTIGIHHYPDIQGIQDDAIRVPVERSCLQLGQQLLLVRAAHINCSHATDAVTADGDGKQQRTVGGGGLSIELVQQLVRDTCGGWL